MPDDPRPDEPATESTAVADSPAAEETEGGTPPREKLVQAVELNDIGPCKKHIKVTIDRGSIDKRLDAKYKEIVPDSNVAGFRPGKAPRALVVRRYAKEVTDQVKAELLLESLEQLAEEHDVAPLAAPNIDPLKIELPKTGPMVYEFDVEVRPQFDLPNYKGLKLKKPVRTFSEDDILSEERRLVAPLGQVQPKPDGDAQLGDVLVATVTNMDGDRVIGTIPETTIRVEERLAFKDGIAPKFLEQVKGAKAGQTREVDVELSDATADEGLRGKSVKAVFEIQEVKQVVPPEMTPEFFKENFGVTSREQLHELIRVVLNRRLEYLQRQSARQQILQQLAGSTEWNLPEDLLRRQARQALNRRIMEMQSQGISDEEINQRVRVMQQDVLQSTALALKEHFVLQKIAEAEKIDVSEEDINDEIERLAEQNNESPRRLRARLERDQLMDALAADVIERRVLDLILEAAEYEEVSATGQPEDAPVSTVEEQAVPGTMADPTAPPPEPPAPEQNP
jgi:trigger factor